MAIETADSHQKMVIFYSYVKLPEDNLFSAGILGSPVIFVGFLNPMNTIVIGITPVKLGKDIISLLADFTSLKSHDAEFLGGEKTVGAWI